MEPDRGESLGALFVCWPLSRLLNSRGLAGAPKPHGSGGDVLAQTEQQLPADKKDPHRSSSPLTGSFQSPGERLGQRHRTRFTRGTGAASPPAAGARQPGELRGLCSGTAGPGAAGSAWDGPVLAELRATAAGKERPGHVATPARVGTPTCIGTPTYTGTPAQPRRDTPLCRDTPSRVGTPPYVGTTPQPYRTPNYIGTPPAVS